MNAVDIDISPNSPVPRGPGRVRPQESAFQIVPPMSHVSAGRRNGGMGSPL